MRQSPGLGQALVVSLAAMLGTGFSELIYLYLLLRFGVIVPPDPIHPSHHWWSEAIAFGVMLVALLTFIDPLIERLRTLLGVAARHGAGPQSGRKSLTALAIAFLAALALFLHNALHAMAEHQLRAVLLVLVGTVLPIGLVTYAWIGGARRPPQAARPGALFAALTNGLSVGIVFLLANVPLTIALHQGLGAAATWGVIGFAGGIAIDRRWGARPSRSVAISLLATGGLCTLVGWLVFHYPLTDTLSNLLNAGGWGLGLLLQPLSDPLLTVGDG
jgi:hypothetical protein